MPETDLSHPIAFKTNKTDKAESAVEEKEAKPDTEHRAESTRKKKQ